MSVIGVTGRYCTGKSTVAEILAAAGFETIDVDRLGHEALASEADLVIAAFGEAVTAEDGTVDRRALGTIVFSDQEALRRLERILHPRMVQMVEARIEAITSGPGVVINAAILQRMGLDELCDTIIFVTAPFLTILRRARDRDGASVFAVIRRLRSQRDVDPQFSPPRADTYSVENDGDRERLRSELARFLPGR